jgi:hypothetical protein
MRQRFFFTEKQIPGFSGSKIIGRKEQRIVRSGETPIIIACFGFSIGAGYHKCLMLSEEVKALLLREISHMSSTR